MGSRSWTGICATIAAAVIALSTRSILGQTTTINTGTVQVELRNVLTSGTTSAIPSADFITTDGVLGDKRLLVVSQSGQVKTISGGAVQSTFFDATAASAIGTNLIAGDERGLLGLAFPPDYSAVGSPDYHKFYTLTSEKPAGNTPTFTNPEMQQPGFTDSAQTQTVIREWTALSDGSAVDPNTASRVLMRIQKPQTNHNGGTLVFGPDKYLYVTLGDGGGANDNNGSPTLTNDGHSNSVNGGPPGNAQDTNVVYGKILRIDPVKPNPSVPSDPANDPNSIPSSNGQYQVPKNNPFALNSSGTNIAGVDEIYAYGLRNPYRISFDKSTGKLFAADVGQGAREEIDTITKGGNYGWVLKEGTLTNGSIGGPYTTPPNLIAPIGEYTHANGVTAVIGGYVSRNPYIPNLYGKYVFGDLTGSDLTGSNPLRLFYMDTNDPGPNTVFKLAISDLGITEPTMDLHGFGEDSTGNIYAAFTNGSVSQIVQIVPLLGDLNRDFQLTNADIQALISAVASPSGYQAAHGNMSLADFKSVADIDGDGTVNVADISALMHLLTGNGISGNGPGTDITPVPEPATWILATVGLLFLFLLRRKISAGRNKPAVAPQLHQRDSLPTIIFPIGRAYFDSRSTKLEFAPRRPSYLTGGPDAVRVHLH